MRNWISKIGQVGQPKDSHCHPGTVILPYRAGSQSTPKYYIYIFNQGHDFLVISIPFKIPILRIAPCLVRDAFGASAWWVDSKPKPHSEYASESKTSLCILPLVFLYQPKSLLK